MSTVKTHILKSDNLSNPLKDATLLFALTQAAAVDQQKGSKVTEETFKRALEIIKEECFMEDEEKYLAPSYKEVLGIIRKTLGEYAFTNFLEGELIMLAMHNDNDNLVKIQTCSRLLLSIRENNEPF